MQCNNQVIHTIQQGDTLYSLARRYNTTVNRLLDLNPGIEVYNLQIGTGLVVCPGLGVTVPPVLPVPPIGTVPVVPPVTAVPPIATLPPISPIPMPTFPTLPNNDMILELLRMIVRFIREQLGDGAARDILCTICNDFSNGGRQPR
jgi:hypothetical protein